jgi:uncharacterized OB-fold protein
MKRQPVDPNLFTEEAEPRLVGGRHRQTGHLAFPLPRDEEYEPLPLPRSGRLWSYTVQRFAPKSPPYAGPQPFEPFAVGYVELPGALIVESRLADVAFDELEIGMPVEFTLVPLRTTADGTTVVTFAFRPARGANR